MPEEVKEELAAKPAKKGKVPKIFKNRYFIFGVSSFLFIISLLTLLLLDESNTLRPKWADFLFNWFKGFGLTFNVQMATWLMFLFIFGLFFAIFFITLFYKKGLENKREKCLRRHDRELSEAEETGYKIRFFVFTFLALGALFAAGIILLSVLNYWSIIGSQFKDFPTQMANFLSALGLILAMILIIPVTFAFLLLIFRFLIMLIAIIAGNVQDNVMRSQNYQQNLAAVQAASNRLQEEAGLKKGRGGRGGGGDGDGNSNAQSPQADIIFPALTSIDLKWEEKYAKEEAERLAAEEAAREALNPSKKGKKAKKAEEVVEEAPVEEAPVEEAPVEEAPKEDPLKPVILNYGAARTTRGAANAEKRPPLDYEQFKVLAYEFQSYLCHNKYYFKINTLRCFIAGMAAARLILLQGLSGTGKSTLPRVFLEYVGGDAYFFPVQATWRDRSDITGYYSDFTGQFKETELLKHLYEASYIPETMNLMVLDEMNISRVEYYFADFLSIFEYPAEDWVVPLMQVKPGTKLPKYIENGMVRIPVNTWFVGTVNIDDSTFTITDKVYDRAIAIDFNELILPFESSYRFDSHPITISELMAMFQECKEKPENNLTPAERKKFLDLTMFISETFDIQFGNRIMNQIDNFLPVFVGLGGTKNEALDFMVARKVLRKLEGKFESYIKDGLNKLNRYLNSTYGKHVFPESEAMIEKYRRKLS